MSQVIASVQGNDIKLAMANLAFLGTAPPYCTISGWAGPTVYLSGADMVRTGAGQLSSGAAPGYAACVTDATYWTVVQGGPTGVYVTNAKDLTFGTNSNTSAWPYVYSVFLKGLNGLLLQSVRVNNNPLGGVLIQPGQLARIPAGSLLLYL